MFKSLIRKFLPDRPSELELSIDKKILDLSEQFPALTLFTKKFRDGQPYIQATFIKDSDNPKDTTSLQKEIAEAANGYTITFDNLFFRDMSYCFPKRKSLLTVVEP